jgi:hypothetical protein
METLVKVGIGVGVVAVVGVGGYFAYQHFKKPVVAVLPPVDPKRALPQDLPIDDGHSQPPPQQQMQQPPPQQTQAMPPPLPPALKGYGVLTEDYTSLSGRPLYWNIQERKLYSSTGTAYGTDENNLVKLVRLADGTVVDAEVYIQPNGLAYQPHSVKPVWGVKPLPTGPDFMVTAPAPNYGGMTKIPLNKDNLPSTMGVGANSVSWRQLRQRLRA